MPRTAARYLLLCAANRLVSFATIDGEWTNTGNGGTTFGGDGRDGFSTSAGDVARNLDKMTKGGEMAERAARWVFLQAREYQRRPIEEGRTAGFVSETDDAKRKPTSNPGGKVYPRDELARRLDKMTRGETMARPKYDLLIELCAGTAALSWATAGLKFPVSRMGSKSGYAYAILSALGLRAGEPLPAYLWNEPDQELARTLALLASPGGAAAVAEVIRSWIPCPAGHAEGGAWCLECATWTNGDPPEGVRESLPEDCDYLERKRDGTIRRWASGPSTGKQDARRLWERLRKERPEASPEREGAWCFVAGGSKFDGESIYGGNLLGQDDGPRGSRDNKKPLTERLPRDCDTLAPLPATIICGRAEDVPTPPDCSRVLCHIDPPYLNTTGYAHGFDRAAVVAVARRWADAGAHVVISEAEPIPELIEDGWHFVDIADARIGQRRTFSKQQREVLTSNRPLVPRHSWPARDALPGQSSLFGPRS
jgi:hypothetical protein